VPRCSIRPRRDRMSLFPGYKAPGAAVMPGSSVARARHRDGVSRWVIAAVLFSLTYVGPAAGALLRLRCTNPASGANWPIIVDLDRGQVDSLPATITDQSISWHDPKQGFFDLDRATGKLEMRNASSTGGYFLHYTCRPE
jgi:hypothetical protein